MATSGTVLFNMTVLDIVTAAFKKIGLNPAEQPLQSVELSDGIQALNLLIKFLQAQNAHLWATTEGTLFLNPFQAGYLLGPGGDHAALTESVIEAKTTADLATSATVIPVNSTIGMLAGDQIGIEIDSYTYNTPNGSFSSNYRHWTTIVSVDSLTQVTITTGIIGAASSGNSIFSYQTGLVRPLRISDVRRKWFAQPGEIALMIYSRQQYFDQVNKAQPGTPIASYYNPTLVDGRMYVWEPTNNVNQYLKFTFYTPLEDAGTQANTISFPVEWLQGIVWLLASFLSPDYNVPKDKSDMIDGKAEAFITQVKEFDEEMTSLNIQPDNTRAS